MKDKEHDFKAEYMEQASEFQLMARTSFLLGVAVDHVCSKATINKIMDEYNRLCCDDKILEELTNYHMKDVV